MNTFCLALTIVTVNFTVILASATAAVVAPTTLSPGSTVSSIPNGFSSGDGIPSTLLFDQSETFSFAGGLNGILRDRVIQYSDIPSLLHPGLYFDYEIQLTSGSIAAATISGYSNFDTPVKVCGVTGCGGSGANGIAPTSATRSIDGNDVSFGFSNNLVAGQYSANLQIFSSASLFQDPLAILTDSSGNSFSINVVGPLGTNVPEPATWAVMILGFVGVFFTSYRESNTDVRSA